jgi:hypothetical protein
MVKNKETGKTIVIDPQVAVREATDPRTALVSSLEKKGVTATIWDNEIDEDHSYVKLDSANGNRLISLPNDELKSAGIVDRLYDLTVPEDDQPSE